MDSEIIEVEPDIYFDGATAKAWPVSCTIAAPSLLIARAEAPVTAWFFSEMFLAGPPSADAPLTLGRGTERLVVRDAVLAGAIAAASPHLQKELAKFAPWRKRQWLLGVAGAAASLAVVALVLRILPALLTPLVPYSWEVALGERIVRHVPGYLAQCSQADADAALKKLADRLSAAMGWRQKIDIQIVSLSMNNAFALPGGRIVIFNGLIQAAQSGDELAAVLAHEMGHVVHRDAMQKMISRLGLSVLGTLLTGGASGDVNAAVTGYGSTMYQLSYSRDAERDADDFSVAALQRAGLRSDGLKKFFPRLDEGRSGEVPLWARTHPPTPERIDRLGSAGESGLPAFTEQEWKAIKAACSQGSRAGRPDLKPQ